MLTIKQLTFTALSLPLTRSLLMKKVLPSGETNTVHLTHLKVWLCELNTDNGIYAQGYTMGIENAVETKVLQDITANWFPLLMQQPLDDKQSPYSKLLESITPEHVKYYYYFLSAIDIALWDAKLQAQECSLADYLKCTATHIPVFGSGGWLDFSDSQLVEECQFYWDRGVKTYKLKVGTERDAKRLAYLRDHFGPELTLLVDANQYYSLENAKRLLPLLESYNVKWFEEPIIKDDTKALQNLSAKSPIAIASGENRQAYADFVSLCATDVKYIQPDIVRCGGITGFFEIVKLCEQKDKFIAPHLNAELGVNVLGALANAYKVEHVNFFAQNFFSHDYVIEDGVIEIPRKPGTNVHFRKDVIEKFKLED